MRPEPSEAPVSLPVEIVDAVGDRAVCSVIPWVSIDGWRAAVQRSVLAAGGTLGQGRPGIRLEQMNPACASGGLPRRGSRRSHYSTQPAPNEETRRTQIHYRAELIDEWGRVIDTSEGISSGVSRTSLKGGEATLSAMETTLELAAQDALHPLLHQQALRTGQLTRWGKPFLAVSPSTRR